MATSGQFTWSNAPLRKYIEKLPRSAESGSQKVGEYLAAATTRNIISVGAVDSGELRDSPHVTRDPNGGRRVTVRAKHGAPVNYGTYKMGARPFWEPALEETAAKFVEIVRSDFAP